MEFMKFTMTLTEASVAINDQEYKLTMNAKGEMSIDDFLAASELSPAVANRNVVNRADGEDITTEEILAHLYSLQYLQNETTFMKERNMVIGDKLKTEWRMDVETLGMLPPEISKPMSLAFQQTFNEVPTRDMIGMSVVDIVTTLQDTINEQIGELIRNQVGDECYNETIKRLEAQIAELETEA